MQQQLVEALAVLGDLLCKMNPEEGNSEIAEHNPSDILAALSGFGCTSGCTADVNGDDQVTVSDFLEILSQYGEFCN